MERGGAAVAGEEVGVRGRYVGLMIADTNYLTGGTSQQRPERGYLLAWIDAVKVAAGGPILIAGMTGGGKASRA